MAGSIRQEREGMAATLRAAGWTWVEVASALRERWPDLTARAAMRIAHGWTQQQVVDEWLARWPDLPRDRKDIGLWENWPARTGRRPSLAVLDKLAEIYRCAAADLLADVYDHRRLDRAGGRAGFPPVAAHPVASVFDGAEPARSLGPAPAATPGGGGDMVGLPVRTPTGETIVVKVSRRDVLRGLGAMAAASVAPTATSRSTPPAGADLVPIEHFQRMRAVLIDSDNLFGAGRALPGAYEQLRLLGQLQRAANGADALAVVDLRAQFAELCAWLNQDLGDNQSAWYWTDRALEWSHLTGDQALTTLTLARKSQLAGDVGDATAAVAYAEAAIGLAPAASRLAAAAHAYAAHGHALAGDRDTTARAYDRSSGILASTDEDPRWAWWGGWLDASYIAVHRAGSLLALGDHEAADREYELALAGLPDAYPRDRGVYLARAARARAGIGDVEGSVSLGTQALATAARSGRRDRELRQLLDDLAPFDAAPVEELRQLAGLSSVGGGTGP